MAIIHQIRRKFATKNEEIVSDLLYGVSGASKETVETMIKRKAAEISIAMAILHGGEWRVQIDHEDGIVHITRRLQRTPKSGAKRG